MQRRAFSWRDDRDVPSFPDDHPLIVFDGTCVLCSANAHFVLRRDRRRIFRLTHAQSALGLALYRHLGLRSDERGTMIALRDGQLLTHSDAAIAIADGLGWPWRAARLASLAPRPLRDLVYRWIARNRYRWFGRRETCWLPPSGLGDRPS
jgi:predicted DCC family thiol-disulfide oxidoreductase YuxK